MGKEFRHLASLERKREEQAAAAAQAQAEDVDAKGEQEAGDNSNERKENPQDSHSATNGTKRSANEEEVGPSLKRRKKDINNDNGRNGVDGIADLVRSPNPEEDKDQEIPLSAVAPQKEPVKEEDDNQQSWMLQQLDAICSEFPQEEEGDIGSFSEGEEEEPMPRMESSNHQPYHNNNRRRSTGPRVSDGNPFDPSSSIRDNNNNDEHDPSQVAAPDLPVMDFLNTLDFLKMGCNGCDCC